MCRTGPRAAALAAWLDSDRLTTAAIVWACVTRLAAAMLPVVPVSDFLFYHTHAVTIANGEGYVTNGQPTAFWPVGQSAFLGLLYRIFGADPLVGRLSGVVLGGVEAFAAHRVAFALTRSRRAANLALLLYVLHPAWILRTAILASENTLIPLLLVGALAQWHQGTTRASRTGSLLLSGLAYGAAVLIKPQFLFVPVVLALAGRPDPRPWRKRWARGLALLAFIAVIAAPWSIRNSLHFGRFVGLSTNGGVTLFAGNNRQATGTSTLTPEYEAIALHTPQWNEVERDEHARTAALKWIAHNPGPWLFLAPFKMWHMFARDEETLYHMTRGLPDMSPSVSRAYFTLHYTNWAGWLAFLACFLLAALLTLWRIRNQRPSADPVGLAVFACTCGFYLIFHGQPRYHAPLEAWMAPYVAWLLLEWMGPDTATLSSTPPAPTAAT